MPAGQATDGGAPEEIVITVDTVEFRDDFLFCLTSPDVQGLCVLEESLKLAFREANVLTREIRALRGQAPPFRFVPKVGWLGRRENRRGG